MKKILLLLLIAVMVYPCYARSKSQFTRFTSFDRIKLFLVDSHKNSGKDVIVYQAVLDENNRAETTFTLEISEESLDNCQALYPSLSDEWDDLQKFESFFEADLNEHDDEDDTLRILQEFTYNDKRTGRLDAYLVKEYTLKEDSKPDTAILELKRGKQIKENDKNNIRIYTFTFKQKLQGGSVPLYDNIGGEQHMFAPMDYFQYMKKYYADTWIYVLNDLRLDAE